MSLRIVHIAFISLCSLLAAGFAIWGIRDYRITGDLFSLVLGLLSAALLLPILAYGSWFIRKSRDLGSQGLIWAILILLGSPRLAAACSVCLVDPDSLMAQGAFWGVLTLGLIISGLLAVIAGVAFSWARRAKKLT